MSDLDGLDEETENTEMNWFTAAVLIAGSPLIVLVFTDHHWAEVALKVYMVTTSVFGYILLFEERKSLRSRWLWIGVIPLLLIHSAAMYGLITFNLAFPRIDRFPVATYGALVPLIGVEGVVLLFILDKFKPKRIDSPSSHHN